MSTDGHDPPKVEGLGSRTQRPKLRVIAGGASLPPKAPDPPALLKSNVSDEGRARLLRTLRLLGAERAFLFVWDEQEFTLSEACVCDERGVEPRDRNVMWSLLDRITSQRAPLVMAGTDDQPTDALMSGITPPLRMAVAVPLVAGAELKGVACFDKRIHRGQYASSDARAALAIMGAQGLEAKHLPAVTHGSAQLPRAPEAPELSRQVLAELSPPTGDIAPFLIHADVAPPRLGEIHFWHCHPLPSGVTRFVLCRLTGSQTQPDLLVARLLSAYRALCLSSELGAGELIKAMAFEIERSGNEPYALHATLLDASSAGGKCSIWSAGEGQVDITQHGNPLALSFESQPLSHGVRSVGEQSLPMPPGTRIACSQGRGSSRPIDFDTARGPQASRWVITFEP